MGYPDNLLVQLYHHFFVVNRLLSGGRNLYQRFEVGNSPFIEPMALRSSVSPVESASGSPYKSRPAYLLFGAMMTVEPGKIEV